MNYDTIAIKFAFYS